MSIPIIVLCELLVFATYLRTEMTRIRISDDYNHSPNSKLYIILLTNEIIQLVLIVK